MAKKDWVAPDRPSLWTAVEETQPSSSRKKAERKVVTGWRNIVTEKVSLAKPKECRGAILADDVRSRPAPPRPLTSPRP